MLNFSVATHYCGGHVAASKISVTGKLASCGMEDQQNDLPPGKYFSRHCCEDYVVSITTDNNYVPSSINIPDAFQFSLQTSDLQSESLAGLTGIFRMQYSGISPPGILMSTNVDLSDICVFRI